MSSRNLLEMLVLCLAALFACGTTAQAEDNKKENAGPTKSAPAARSPAPAARSPGAPVHAPVGPAGPGVAHAPAGHPGPGVAHAPAGHPSPSRAGQVNYKRHEFHGRDVHRFSRDELTHWRGGRWNNSCYNGRCGWWWFAGGQSYFYARPIYPYPLVVSEILYAEPMVVVPVVVAAPMMSPPVVRSPLPVTAAPQFWYYCDDPQGYYPYVANCNTQYRQVPVSPAGQR